MKSKILICDDDEGILDVTRIILEDKGYLVNVCSNGEGIEKMVEDIKPALVLLDLWMPGPGGEEITLNIRANKKIQNTPIVIISASKDASEIALKIGANECLNKPYDIEDLENIAYKYTMKKPIN